MDQKTQIRFIKAEAPKDLKRDISYLDFYQKYEDGKWSNLFEPISNTELIKVNNKAYALPYCKDMYLVNYYYEVSAKNFYNYINIDEKKKKLIKNYFRNLTMVNNHRKEEFERLIAKQEDERVEKEIEERQLISKIKKLLP